MKIAGGILATVGGLLFIGVLAVQEPHLRSVARGVYVWLWTQASDQPIPERFK